MVSRGTDTQIEEIRYLNGIYSDHAALYIVYSISENSRGPGYWKLNARLLQCNELVLKLGEKIKIATQQRVFSSSIQKWLSVKKQIIEFCEAESRSRADDIKIVIGQLSELLTSLQENFPLNREDSEIYLKT